ncbi:helix-turn-helix domain-containing protein [Providencia rettgeri]
MALVSISEAARLTGKSRTTVQSYIKQGKLTKCTDSGGHSKLDTSELLRVFGSFTGQQVGSITAPADYRFHRTVGWY